jgi:Asp-tRNA(Asn)/Glu-tRNA(Gln) amidotransferase A subunit family amidase
MEYVWLANFTGCPCLTVPVGYAKPEGSGGDLPIGMMAMGEWGNEDGLIDWGYDGEKYLTESGRKRPPVWVDVLEKGKGPQVNGGENGTSA